MVLGLRDVRIRFGDCGFKVEGLRVLGLGVEELWG